METWNRLTTAKGEGGGEELWKERGRDEPKHMYE